MIFRFLTPVLLLFPSVCLADISHPYIPELALPLPEPTCEDIAHQAKDACRDRFEQIYNHCDSLPADSRDICYDYVWDESRKCSDQLDADLLACRGGEPELAEPEPVPNA